MTEHEKVMHSKYPSECLHFFLPLVLAIYWFRFDNTHFCFMVKGPAEDATDAPQPRGLLCNPVMKVINFFFIFPSNGAPVE